MAENDRTVFARALDSVAHFSEQDLAVLPEIAPVELVRNLAALTGLDADLVARLYDLIIAKGRLDKYTDGTITGPTGFAEE